MPRKHDKEAVAIVVRAGTCCLPRARRSLQGRWSNKRIVLSLTASCDFDQPNLKFVPAQHDAMPYFVRGSDVEKQPSAAQT